MKRIVVFTWAIVAIQLQAFATIHTVCNMPYSPGQFNNFNSAQSVAADGDTIYVHGSNFSYGDATIFVNNLVVIGAGIRPDKQLPMTSAFGHIQMQASGVQLIGLTIVEITSSGFPTNCAIRKCKLLGSTGGTCLGIFGAAWTIEGCVIDAPTINVAFDMGNNQGSHVIQHNIFAIDRPAIFNLKGTAGNPAYVLNNIFLGDGASFFVALDNTNNIVIRNNIFYGILPYSAASPPQGLALVERNMVFNSGDDNFYPIGLYPDNYAGVDPIFNSYNGVNMPHSFANDFTLAPGSLGNNYGTDATDVGVFGGIGEIFTVTGEPSIAEITVFDITSPTTVAPGGNLSISVTSKRVK